MPSTNNKKSRKKAQERKAKAAAAEEEADVAQTFDRADMFRWLQWASLMAQEEQSGICYITYYHGDETGNGANPSNPNVALMKDITPGGTFFEKYQSMWSNIKKGLKNGSIDPQDIINVNKQLGCGCCDKGHPADPEEMWYGIALYSENSPPCALSIFLFGWLFNGNVYWFRSKKNRDRLYKYLGA
jgi:hypothetical protein